MRSVYIHIPFCKSICSYCDFCKFLYKDTWAILECKKSATASYRPNQEYYLAEYDKMSFARTIYPENKEEVLDDLQRAFESRR